MVTGCARCGKTLPPLRSSGRPRKWCSETCRVRAYEERNPKLVFAKSRVWFRTCDECAVLFTSRSPAQVNCSPGCVKARARRRYREQYAAAPAAERERFRRRRLSLPDAERDKNRARNQQRRAILYGAEAESFLPSEIYDRDGWTCQLCLVGIDRALRFPDPWSPTIDHATPLSLGGAHTRANVRAAHLHCNSARGNRVS